MNPLLQEALASILRWGLALFAGYLVKAGIWSSTDAQTYVGAGALAILALAWSLWQKYGSRLKLVTAMAAPRPVTEHQVEAMIANPAITNPSVNTGKDTVPVPPFTH